MKEKQIVFKDSMPKRYLIDIIGEFMDFRQTGRWRVQGQHNYNYMHWYEGEVIYPIMLRVENELEYRGMAILRQLWPSQLTSQFLLKIVIPEARHEFAHNTLWSGLKKFSADFGLSVEKNATVPFYVTMVEGEVVSNNEPRQTYTLREILSKNALRPEYTTPIKRDD